MSNQVILFFMLGLFFVDANAQLSINPSVTATTGNYFGTPGSLEVSYTLGEMTAITTAGNVSDVHVTQGFHQPEELEDWNQRLLLRGPSSPESAAKFKKYLDAIDPVRTDLTAWSDLQDLEEGRIVPQRIRESHTRRS